MDAAAVAVGEDLHFDMAWFGEVALHVALVAAEIAGGFALSGVELGGGFAGGVDHLHASTATAVGRLDRNRPSVVVAEGDYLTWVGDQICGAGYARDPDLLGCLARGDLVAHHINCFGWGTDEGDAPFGDGTGEVGIFGEEAVAGVDGIGSAALDGGEDGVGVEVGLGSSLSTEGVGLIGQPNMERIAIEVAVDGRGRDAEFAARPDHPDRDFSAVGDEYFRKHVLITSRMNPRSATPAPNAFPRSADEAVAAGFGLFHHVSVTGSTNTDLAEEARAGVREPAVLVADFQSEGKGRLDRVWQAAAGLHLLVSFRLPAGDRTAPDVIGAIVAAARHAADASITPAVRLKWPNDLVVIDGPKPGKLAGVLSEYVPGEPSTVVVGMGMNVGVTMVEGATSLSDCGGDPDRDDLLAALIRGLPSRLSDRYAVALELRRHSATLGTRVRVTFPLGRTVTGMAVEFDADGRLMLDDGTTVHVVSVGDVVHLRPET